MVVERNQVFKKKLDFDGLDEITRPRHAVSIQKSSFQEKT